MIQVLAIMGSPRRNKNNDTLLEHVLRGLQSPDVIIDKFYVDQLNIHPCKACAACIKKIGCILQDEMQLLYEKFNQSDIIILTSPLYFNSISAQLKSVIDRCQAIWSSKYILNHSMIDRNKRRIGFFICTAGEKEHPDLFKAAIPVMDLFFKSINAEYAGNLLISNVDENPVYNDEMLLKKAFEIGIQLKSKFLHLPH